MSGRRLVSLLATLGAIARYDWSAKLIQTRFLRVP